MTNNGWFAIRTDAAIHIGSGHLMRCLTLAKALQLRGYQGYLLSVDLPEACVQLLDNAGIKHVVLPSGAEQNTRAYAHSHWLSHDESSDLKYSEIAINKLSQEIGEQPAFIFVDHYALAAPWETALSKFAPVLAIDDLNDRPHSAHWVLDQTVGKTTHSYNGLLGPRTRLLLGGQYALLRGEFARLRERALAKRRQREKPKRILLTLGGADQKNVTASVLRDLQKAHLPRDIFVDVVVGAMNPHLQNVQQLCDSLERPAQISVAVCDMAERMLEADICIGAAGATAWERCVLGLPSINLVLADNQKAIAKNIADAGAALMLDNTSYEPEPSLPAAIDALMNDTEMRTVMSEKAFLMCDGLGIDRVLKELLDDY